MAVDAVIFDWGGTLTPWHTIDLREQWAAYPLVYDHERSGLDLIGGAVYTSEIERTKPHPEAYRLGDLLPVVGGWSRA